MDRLFVWTSTFCYLLAVARTAVVLRNGVFRAGRFNFFAVLAGFVFQTIFLSFRGHALGRCPITNLFEVIIFVAWSVALFYMVVGPAYRLSLMGAFTAPFVVVLQLLALITPVDRPHPAKLSANTWLEFHASMSLVA